MSIEQMRAMLKKFYSDTWRRKVDAMPDNQVAAIYQRWLDQGKFKNL